MLIKIICIVALLDFSLSEYDALYVPMKKNSKYGDEVCMYYDDKQIHVKPCEKGKFCDSSNTIGTLDYARGKGVDESGTLAICQDLPNISTLYTYNEGSCTNDFECVVGYKCIGNVCSRKCDTGRFFSEISEPSLEDSDGCKDNSYKGTDGICYEETRKKNEPTIYKYSSPVEDKECMKITFDDDPHVGSEGKYYVNKKEYVYKGEVEDGEYVIKKEFCKSGFALYFFKDGKTEDPATSGNNQMYLRCVTPISVSNINSGDCTINYKISESGELLRYNTKKLQEFSSSQLSSTQYSQIKSYCTDYYIKYVKFKFDNYREFYTKISKEERKTCGDLESANKYTCENNELIKLFYFYKNPEKYFAYNDRKIIDKVLDYYIQTEYPCYSLSRFLSLEFIYLLILLLF